MTRRLIALLAACAVVGGAACGEDDEGRPRSGFEDASERTSSVETVEKLTRVVVPEGASDVRAEASSAQDTLAAMQFTASERAARRAVKAAGVTLQDRHDLTPSTRLHWQDVGFSPPTARRVIGARVDGDSMVVEVALTPRPDGQATVYVFAATS